jgi:hypothetical protein
MTANIWYVLQTKVIQAALSAGPDDGSQWALADGDLCRRPSQVVSAGSHAGLPQAIADPDHRAA